MDFGGDPDARQGSRMDFGGDPDAQYKRDRSVITDMKQDLGASFRAGRTGITNGGPTPGSRVGKENMSTNAIDAAEAKHTELLQSQLNNQPLKRPSRKRKREDSMDFGGDPDAAASALPSAKRPKIEPAHGSGSGSLSVTAEHSVPAAVAPAPMVEPEPEEPPEPEREYQTDLDALEAYLHGRPSVNDTSLMITNDTDGEALYVHYDSRLHYQREMKQSLRLNARGRAKMSMLTDGQTIDALMDEVQAERIASQLNSEIDVMSEDFEELAREQQNDNGDGDGDGEEDIEKAMKKKAKAKAAKDGEVDTELWVDKYAPNGIMSLLSSEKINREVTAWVKQWDLLVFGHKYVRSQHDGNNKFVHNKAREAEEAAAKEAERSKKSKPKLMYSVMNNLPAMGMGGMGMRGRNAVPKVRKEKRPEISVVLFAGPPGTGKSTLAHIVANHCGYRPFEINASDDRNGKKLREVIVAAATTRPMFGDTRPPLIIMDEIDGALNSNGDSKSAVDVILKLVKEAKEFHEKKEKKKDKKGKSNNKIVNRPIICICNNEYAKSLRPLREICTVHRFKPIATRTLCKRLLDICRREFIHTDMRTLSYLAGITNNDVRASLHTLQFFKENSGNGSRLSSRLTADQLQNTPIGRKDKTQNIFDVWNKILKTRDADKQKAAADLSLNPKKKRVGMKAHWQEMASMMYGLGNNNKVLDGVIGNYLTLGFSDPTFAICSETAQWIESFDRLKHLVGAKQHWSLMAYLPLMMAGVHESCATDTFQRLTYPKAGYLASVALKDNTSLLRRFLTAESEAGSKVRKVAKGADTDDVPIIDTTQFASLLGRYFGAKACALSLVPMLPFLVLTSERWNNSDFATEQKRDYGGAYDVMSREKSNKRLFVGIIGTMIECGLTFAKRDKNSVEMFLSPPIDRLSKYKFTDPTFRQRAALPRMRDYVKSKVSHQIVLEVLRRNEAGFNKYKKSGDIEAGDDESDEGDKAGPMRSSSSSSAMTPFMSSKQNKRVSRTKNMLQTPCGDGQFGRHVPNNMLTQQQCGDEDGGSEHKNFLVAHIKSKSGIQKYEFPILYRFVEGYTNAVRRKSFVQDWI